MPKKMKQKPPESYLMGLKLTKSPSAYDFLYLYTTTNDEIEDDRLFTDEKGVILLCRKKRDIVAMWEASAAMYKKLRKPGKRVYAIYDMQDFLCWMYGSAEVVNLFETVLLIN